MRLLLVAPSGSYRVGAFLDAARALHCEVTVATDAEPAIPGSALSVSFDCPTEAAARLAGLVDAVDAVVGTDGAAVAVAAETARRLGRRANPAAAVTAAGDKHMQRRAAAAAGVVQPDFALVEGADLRSWSTFPAVVKPLDRSASQGVVRADSPHELTEALRTVRTITGAGAPLLVEAFAPGLEVAVEAVVRAGRLDVLAVFDKPDNPQGPTFPETLLVSPARLDAGVRERVVDVAGRAVAAVGVTEGPVHVECKVDGGEVRFLELAARSIGGLCSRAVATGGVSLEEVVIRHALGEEVVTTAVEPTGSGVLMLPVPHTGRLESVRGINAARGVPGVTDVVIAVGTGQEVVALPAGDRYLGFVFARAPTADLVEVALRAAWSAIEVDVTAS